MKVILGLMYLAFSVTPLLVSGWFLRKWSLEMEQKREWWLFQPIEQKWGSLASASMSWLIIAVMGAFAFFGPA